jgi:hypothetical protein
VTIRVGLMLTGANISLLGANLMFITHDVLCPLVVGLGAVFALKAYLMEEPHR